MSANSKVVEAGQPGSLTDPAAAEFDFCSRAASYALAHKKYPLARNEELQQTLELIQTCAAKITVEVGAGQGFLTQHLYHVMEPAGSIIAVDDSAQQLAQLESACPNVRCLKARSEDIPLPTGSVDLVVSLANFHHNANKPRAFAECARLLKPGGLLALVDVCDKTRLQRYFDEIIAATCSTGHQHTFLDRAACEKLCRDSGLELMRWQMQNAPWRFVDDHGAGFFLKHIHDARCSSEQIWRDASSYLGFAKTLNGEIALNWELFFMLARKGTPAS